MVNHQIAGRDQFAVHQHAVHVVAQMDGGDADTVIFQPLGIGPALVAQRVVGDGNHQGGGRAVQRYGFQWRCPPVKPVTHFWGVVGNEIMHRCGGQGNCRRHAPVGVAAGGQIHHRVNEHLKHRRGRRAIAPHQRQNGGQIAPGTVTAHADAPRRYRQRQRVVADPLQGGGGVLQRCRKRVFRRQPVVNGDDANSCAVGQSAANPVMALQVADNPAAAVQKHHTGQGFIWPGSCSTINPQRQAAAPGLNHLVANRCHFFSRGLQHVPTGGIGGSRFFGRQRFERASACLAAHFEQRFYLGIQCWHGDDS